MNIHHASIWPPPVASRYNSRQMQPWACATPITLTDGR